MAGIAVAAAPSVLETLLGSCVGIALWCPETRLGSLAHVMLGESQGRMDQPGRFVDTAIPAMLKELLQKGAHRGGLSAKLCGGAQMFKTASGNHEVGRRNVEKAVELLCLLRIPVVAQHVGGTAGRVIAFDLQSSAISIKIGRDVVAVI